MGFALRSGSALLAPLAGWIARRAALYAIDGGASAPAAAASIPARPAALAPVLPRRPAALPATPAVRLPAAVTAARPLRMLRVVDAGAPQASAGRMRMSGRMADVCAELERLAAREAQQAARGLCAG